MYAEMKDSRTWIGQPASILSADERARLERIPGAIVNGVLQVNYLVSQYADLWASDDVSFYDDVTAEQDITDITKLLTATRKRLAEREVPTLEVNVSAADLFKIDRTEARPGLGDTVLLVDPELGLERISARITEMTEYPYEINKHTQLTVANVMRRDYAQIIADLESQRRTVEQVFSGGRIRADAFEEFARTAVIDINASKTEVKYDTRGIILEDKTDARRQVVMSANGIYLTTDGGANARTAITPNFINAEVISGQLGSFVSMLIGEGNNVVKINANGISAGHDDFNNAPFRAYMNGDVVMSQLTAKSARISTSNLNGSNWQDGYFSGNITAVGEITGGTITGALLRTARTGQRIEMDANSFRSVDSNNRIRVSISQNGKYGVAGTEYFDGAGTYKGGIYGIDDGFYVDAPNYMNLYAPVIAFNGNVRFDNATSVSGIRISSVDGLQSVLTNLRSDVDTKATSGRATGSAGPYNCGIPIGTVLRDVDGKAYTWTGVPSHTHSQN